MDLVFRAISEDAPGPKWAAHFHELWPEYRAWWAREGLHARPNYLESRRMLGEYMPEILGLYDKLSELAGGGDAEARFLSFYCPPPYLTGCSQAVWGGDEPLLVRNYDYAPQAFEAVVWRTAWQGRKVVGTSDGLWGLVDGVNDAGLAVSLTFGGRRVVGDGFGVPLILRYVLQIAESTKQAVDILRRVPCHMSYNVTILDRRRLYATVYLAPDRPAEVTRAPAATNHQGRVEWSSHARFTATVERERYLLDRLTLHPETAERFVQAFLRPPLYSIAYAKGFGTLYTAAYRPRKGGFALHWPGSTWQLPLDRFAEAKRRIQIPFSEVLH